MSLSLIHIFLALLISGVDDELAGLLVAADAHASQRALERHTAEQAVVFEEQRVALVLSLIHI